MKSLLPAVLALCLPIKTLGQGYIAIDNDANSATSTPTATSGGLFFFQLELGVSPVVKISGDFNLALYGGTDSANLTLIASFSDGAAAGSSFFGDGTWTDPTGSIWAVPGTTSASTSAFFRIEAWTGYASSFQYAPFTGGAFNLNSRQVFSNPVGPAGTIVPDLTGMPAIILTAEIPEPNVCALAALGVAILCPLFHRKLSKPGRPSL